MSSTPDVLRVFADSNILLYAASGRPADAAKAARARQALRAHEIVISFQVLQEFYVNAVHPRKLGLTAKDAAAYCRTWLAFDVAPLTASTFVRTLELGARYRISHWDAAILAAACEAGCATVYSEDLSHGEDYGGARVENPFRES